MKRGMFCARSRSKTKDMLKSMKDFRVRFAEDSKTIQSSSSTVSKTDCGSTLEGDDAFEVDDVSESSQSTETETVTVADSPGCTNRGDSLDFQGVAVESFKALTLSAVMVSETVFALGGEIRRLPYHCGFEKPLETTETRLAEETRWGRGDRVLGRVASRDNDSSSVESCPPFQKKRRKRPFAFFGLSNRAKKNYQEALPKSVDIAPPPEPKAATPPRNCNKAIIRVKDPSPQVAKRLLTGCFMKKPADDCVSLQSRYRTENEDMQMTGGQSVYTIRMTRVASDEYDAY